MQAERRPRLHPFPQFRFRSAGEHSKILTHATHLTTEPSAVQDHPAHLLRIELYASYIHSPTMSIGFLYSVCFSLFRVPWPVFLLRCSAAGTTGGAFRISCCGSGAANAGLLTSRIHSRAFSSSSYFAFLRDGKVFLTCSALPFPPGSSPGSAAIPETGLQAGRYEKAASIQHRT